LRIKFVYKILPSFIFEIDFDENVSFAILNTVFIQKGSTDGELEHELVHIKQMYRTFGISTVLYKLSQYYRLKYEVEAFKKQIEADKLKDLEIIRISGVIAEDYNIEYVSEDDIFASLKG